MYGLREGGRFVGRGEQEREGGRKGRKKLESEEERVKEGVWLER